MGLCLLCSPPSIMCHGWDHVSRLGHVSWVHLRWQVTFKFDFPLYVCAARHGFAFEISLAWSFTAESGAEIKGTLT